jgi:hypothetical protein
MECNKAFIDLTSGDPINVGDSGAVANTDCVSPANYSKYTEQFIMISKQRSAL